MTLFEKLKLLQHENKYKNVMILYKNDIKFYGTQENIINTCKRLNIPNHEIIKEKRTLNYNFIEIGD